MRSQANDINCVGYFSKKLVENLMNFVLMNLSRRRRLLVGMSMRFVPKQGAVNV